MLTRLRSNAERRPPGFWEVYNRYWRGYYHVNGKKPRQDDISRWYQENSSTIWPGDNRPSLEDIFAHSKGLHTTEHTQSYSREYRLRKRPCKAGFKDKKDEPDTTDQAGDKGDGISSVHASRPRFAKRRLDPSTVQREKWPRRNQSGSDANVGISGDGGNAAAFQDAVALSARGDAKSKDDDASHIMPAAAASPKDARSASESRSKSITSGSGAMPRCRPLTSGVHGLAGPPCTAGPGQSKSYSVDGKHIAQEGNCANSILVGAAVYPLEPAAAREGPPAPGSCAPNTIPPTAPCTDKASATSTTCPRAPPVSADLPPSKTSVQGTSHPLESMDCNIEAPKDSSGSSTGCSSDGVDGAENMPQLRWRELSSDSKANPLVGSESSKQQLSASVLGVRTPAQQQQGQPRQEQKPKQQGGESMHGSQVLHAERQQQNCLAEKVLLSLPPRPQWQCLAPWQAQLPVAPEEPVVLEPVWHQKCTATETSEPSTCADANTAVALSQASHVCIRGWPAPLTNTLSLPGGGPSVEQKRQHVPIEPLLSQDIGTQARALSLHALAAHDGQLLPGTASFSRSKWSSAGNRSRVTITGGACCNPVQTSDISNGWLAPSWALEAGMHDAVMPPSNGSYGSSYGANWYGSGTAGYQHQQQMRNGISVPTQHTIPSLEQSVGPWDLSSYYSYWPTALANPRLPMPLQQPLGITVQQPSQPLPLQCQYQQTVFAPEGNFSSAGPYAHAMQQQHMQGVGHHPWAVPHSGSQYVAPFVYSPGAACHRQTSSPAVAKPLTMPPTLLTEIRMPAPATSTAPALAQTQATPRPTPADDGAYHANAYCRLPHRQYEAFQDEQLASLYHFHISSQDSMCAMVTGAPDAPPLPGPSWTGPAGMMDAIWPPKGLGDNEAEATVPSAAMKEVGDAGPLQDIAAESEAYPLHQWLKSILSSPQL